MNIIKLLYSFITSILNTYQNNIISIYYFNLEQMVQISTATDHNQSFRLQRFHR
jgi:hypothetical protein